MGFNLSERLCVIGLNLLYVSCQSGVVLVRLAAYSSLQFSLVRKWQTIAAGHTWTRTALIIRNQENLNSEVGILCFIPSWRSVTIRTVFSDKEARVVDQLHDLYKLKALLIYGSGLSRSKLPRLEIQDPRSGKTRRHQVNEATLQKKVVSLLLRHE